MSNEEQPMMIPQDLHSLYMIGRTELSGVLTFFQIYQKYLHLIDVGKEMLPDEFSDLRMEAEVMLSDPETYPETRQMALEGNYYRLGPGTSKTGLIEVRQEDILVGLDEVKNQQATTLLPLVKQLDNKIFNTLVKCGIIEIRSPSSMEVLMSIAHGDNGFIEEPLLETKEDKK